MTVEVKRSMTMTISAKSLWERRMDADKPMPIVSYYPEIGRGNIEHDAVSHKEVEKGIDGCARRSLWEAFIAWLGI